MRNHVRTVGFVLLASVGAYVTVKFGVPGVSGRVSSLVKPASAASAASATPVVVTSNAPAASSAQRAYEKEEAWTGVLLSQTVDLVARIDAKVKLLNFKVGDHVREGDSLGELDTASYQFEIAAAEASLRASQAEMGAAGVAIAQARDRQNRRAQLFKGVGGTNIPGISKEEFEDSKYDTLSARSRAGVASASAEERRARLAQMHQIVTQSTFRAPFDGVLSVRYAEVGTHVVSGSPVLRVVGRGGMRVRFAVPEIEAAALQLTSRVMIEWDNRTLYATVDRIAPEVESASSTIIMEALVEPGPGSFGHTEEKGPDALAGRVVGVRLAPRPRG